MKPVPIIDPLFVSLNAPSSDPTPELELVNALVALLNDRTPLE
jgi:hypothetical protein